MYAKYGHIFASKELTEYFSQFAWYKPTRAVSDSDLNEVDRINIRIIQEFEKMDDKRKTITWGPEKEGVWQHGYGMAAGWSDRFVIYSDNRMEFLFSQMAELKLIESLVGTYSIRGNVLVFSVSQIDIYNHDAEYEYSSCDGFEWKNSVKNTVYFEKPLILRFPVSEILTENEYNIPDVLCVKIGGYVFYKKEEDVTKKN
jgi:hypothetical protein